MHQVKVIKESTFAKPLEEAVNDYLRIIQNHFNVKILNITTVRASSGYLETIIHIDIPDIEFRSYQKKANEF